MNLNRIEGQDSNKCKAHYLTKRINSRQSLDLKRSHRSRKWLGWCKTSLNLASTLGSLKLVEIRQETKVLATHGSMHKQGTAAVESWGEKNIFKEQLKIQRNNIYWTGKKSVHVHVQCKWIIMRFMVYNVSQGVSLSLRSSFSSFSNPIKHVFYPPNICIGIVFDFSWDIFMGGMHYGIWESRECITFWIRFWLWSLCDAYTN